MFSMTIPTNKKGRASRAPAKTMTALPYPPHRPLVNRIFPGRKDRHPPIPPASAPRPTRSGDSTALALLVLLLSARASELPAHQVHRGWALAERWLGQLVSSKHATEAA